MVIEMRIPYAFSAESKQTWGLNFREIRRDRFKYTLNFIDSKLGTFTQQTILQGIENIKPPMTFLFPFYSFLCQCKCTTKHTEHLKAD
jgi:hypothetical protein